MNQRRFFGNDFFYKKFAYSASVKIRSRHSLCAEYRVLAKPNNRFWSRICKIRFKNRELVPTRPACCDCKLENFLSKKITARIKWNLKMDGLDRKMIFKFGRHIERLYSARKQGRRIYIVCICKQCVCLYKHHLRCKILVGKSQTLELHPLDAGLASPNEKVYGSNTLSAIGKKLFQVKKENCDD